MPETDDHALFGQDLLATYAKTVARRRAGETGPDLEVAAAQTLIRLGSPVEALRALRRIDGRTTLPPRLRREVLGLRASAHKAAALGQRPGPARARQERLALVCYRRAYEADGDGWPAVNLASLCRLGGDASSAQSWAQRALRAVDDKAERDGWEEATRAEALLVLGRLDDAMASYQAAPFMRDRRWTDRAVARRQAERLLAALGLPAPDATAWLSRALPGPTLGLVAGHMLDRPDRPSPRFPPEAAEAVGEAIAAWARAQRVEFGVASAACGSDLLFHEALRRAGLRTRVVLPFPADEFRAASVSHAGAVWERRFADLLRGGAEWVSLVSTQPLGAQRGWFEYGNEYMEGLALCKADEIGAPVRRLAIWDGREGDGPGGTASTVRRWIARGEAFDVIDPLFAERGARAYAPPAGRLLPDAGRAPDVVGLLSADAKGYGRLDEDQLARFSEHFLARIREVVDDAARGRGEVPDLVKTAGDGILVAVADLGALARLALDLRDRVARVHWELVGLPRDLTLRIALHAGPVRRVTDPVTGRPDLLGSHVSHVARLEPVTPPRTVFASEGFATLQRLRCPEAARCRFAGRAPWAKDYGDRFGGLPMYRVERPSAGT